LGSVAGMNQSLQEIAATIPLTDNHCHGVIRGNVERDVFEITATESDWPEPNGMTIFDSPVGIMMRAECANLLDLPRHCSPDDYFNRRYELGQDEVSRRLVPTTGISTFIVDSGFKSSNVLLPSEMQELVPGSRAYEIVRLETVAEHMAAGTTAKTFIADYAGALATAAKDAIGFKSIMAYRFGLDFNPARPTSAEVEAAAGEWLRSNQQRGKIRMDHPVLLRHILWEAVDYKMAIQFHVGYGDSDIVMHRCDPTQMTEFLRMTVDSGTSIMLLHCYPFTREAGYLAQVYPHVYLDTGASAHWTGLSSPTIVSHSVEMAPMSKVLFSSDAFGLPELYYVGTLVWRRAMGEILNRWVQSDGLGYDDAVKYLNWMANDNARRAYRLLPE